MTLLLLVDLGTPALDLPNDLTIYTISKVTTLSTNNGTIQVSELTLSDGRMSN